MKPNLAKKIDSNQNQILKDLAKIPGIDIERDHDDVLISYQGVLHWFEIKNPHTTILKSGLVNISAFKKSQIKLLRNFRGPYHIVWTTDDILHHLGIKQNPGLMCGHCWLESFDSSPDCKLGDPACHCEKKY